MFEDINTNEFASKNIPVEQSSEEDLRRDTYLVTNGAKHQPNCKTKVKPSTPKVTKLISKPITGKTRKTVVSKKKLSPISGNCYLEILRIQVKYLSTNIVKLKKVIEMSGIQWLMHWTQV